MRVAKWCSPHRRCSLVKHNRQRQLLGRLVHEAGVVAERVEPLVIRSKLDALEAKVGDAALDLGYDVTLLWVYGHEADKLLRIRACERRGLCVDVTWPPEPSTLAAGRHLSALEANAKHARAVDSPHRFHEIGPAHGRIDDAIWPPLAVRLSFRLRHRLAVRRCVCMDVD